MKNKKTIRDFMSLLRQWDILNDYFDYFFSEDTNHDLSYLEETGDVEEFCTMTKQQFIAYMSLLQAMNFLEAESSLAVTPLAEDWVGRPHHWHGMNAYWITKFPSAYRYLEVAVWG